MIKRSFNIAAISTIYIVIKQNGWSLNSRIIHNNQGVYYLQQNATTPQIRVHNTTMTNSNQIIYL